MQYDATMQSFRNLLSAQLGKEPQKSLYDHTALCGINPPTYVQDRFFNILPIPAAAYPAKILVRDLKVFKRIA